MRDPLFQPWDLGELRLDNRMVMPAMHLNMCKDFMVTDQLCDFYRARAVGGVSLISVGYATVDELSGSPANIGAHDDSFLPGLTRLAQAIHEGGAKAAVQINHAGRYNSSYFLAGQQPVAPSPVPSRMTKETPREMSVDEIRSTIVRFGDAAVRVREAGFDVVEILAGTGYLISSFLSPLTNKRDDDYGGSFENRIRFGLELVDEVRSRLGSFPLLIRINGNDFMEGGIGPDELNRFAAALEKAGADALCINVGWHEAQVPQIVTKVPRGVFAYMAREIRKNVAIPVIASHRINDPGTARKLIAGGYCDAVAVGRALIADPEFVNKTREGRPESIVHCVACGQGCFDNIFKMKPVECLCNPMAGHEASRRPKRVDVPRNVMVVGGGVAGISAALAAAANGHNVHLYEQSGRLGGQLHLAGAAPGRGEFLVLADDLNSQLTESGVEVTLNRQVDDKLLHDVWPDVLILGTGGEPVTPPIAGSDLPHVVQAWDVLAGRAAVGQKVVVIGGGAVGVETAISVAEEGTLSGEELKFLLVHGAESMENLSRLATEGEREVVLLELADKLGMNFGRSTRWGMLQDLVRYNIQASLGAEVLEIGENSVRYRLEGTDHEMEADSVVLAVGTSSVNPLEPVARELEIDCRVVGDAVSPGTVFEASHQGYLAGLRIQ